MDSKLAGSCGHVRCLFPLGKLVSAAGSAGDGVKRVEEADFG